MLITELLQLHPSFTPYSRKVDQIRVCCHLYSRTAGGTAVGGYQISANLILRRSKQISNITLVENLHATPGINKNMAEVRLDPQDEMCYSTLGLALILRDPVNKKERQLISPCFNSFL